MKSCVSVMKLITTVIKKFITEGVNSCQMKDRFFGCPFLRAASLCLQLVHAAHHWRAASVGRGS